MMIEFIDIMEKNINLVVQIWIYKLNCLSKITLKNEKVENVYLECKWACPPKNRSKYILEINDIDITMFSRTRFTFKNYFNI